MNSIPKDRKNPELITKIASAVKNTLETQMSNMLKGVIYGSKAGAKRTAIPSRTVLLKWSQALGNSVDHVGRISMILVITRGDHLMCSPQQLDGYGLQKKFKLNLLR
ncbi:hypothetical protein PoB_005711100 [Plakobranchus ocellatus]|uniref:Uncharacterized protein n=1 Tax=Plakobranchus ocellatus TaxID=259542 RepID=A0AAV4CCY6_9GAST|nr:hypothetical protein PoB_005711100 [Plakobranchus ocellatus]